MIRLIWERMWDPVYGLRIRSDHDSGAPRDFKAWFEDNATRVPYCRSGV